MARAQGHVSPYTVPGSYWVCSTVRASLHRDPRQKSNFLFRAHAPAAVHLVASLRVTGTHHSPTHSSGRHFTQTNKRKTAAAFCSTLVCCCGHSRTRCHFRTSRHLHVHSIHSLTRTHTYAQTPVHTPSHPTCRGLCWTQASDSLRVSCSLRRTGHCWRLPSKWPRRTSATARGRLCLRLLGSPQALTLFTSPTS